jgi:ergothioneine biosynthesis protein EgtB
MTTFVNEATADERRVRDSALAALVERYQAVRALTESLAMPLSPEDQTVQSMPDVSPTKWHRAHTSWFFETFLLDSYSADYSAFHPSYSYLFNSYYEAVGRRYARPDRGLVSRPGCADIARYRRHVDVNMMQLLEGALDPRATALVELGLHHEQQHQELLLMDIKHVLSMSPLDPPYVNFSAEAAAPRGSPGGWFEHGGGQTEIGRRGEGFCFDNETPSHAALLTPFALAERLVTCGQWMEFMADDGYQRPEFWLSDGWAAVQADGWTAPMYWEREGSQWTVFTLGGRRRVDPDEPVCHVSYFEADAFAHWSGFRLPTEFEWEAVASTYPAEGRFLDPSRPHPGPQTGPTWYGDAWVWTASAYLPYPGFRTAPGAVGEYNGKFMVNQHVLRGGSCATPSGHVRASYRNFFPPSARWPFTGVRLARDL